MGIAKESVSTRKGLCAERHESTTSVTRHRSQKKPKRRTRNQELEVEAAHKKITTNHHRLTRAPRPDSRQQQKPASTPPLAGFFLSIKGTCR
jgi:hypothetical protein